MCIVRSPRHGINLITGNMHVNRISSPYLSASDEMNRYWLELPFQTEQQQHVGGRSNRKSHGIGTPQNTMYSPFTHQLSANRIRQAKREVNGKNIHLIV